MKKHNEQAIKDILLMLNKAYHTQRTTHLNFDNTIRDVQILNERKYMLQSICSDIMKVLENNGWEEEEICAIFSGQEE